MRICLVSHGFPPVERTGVENYTAGLAGALVRAGHTVDVFAPRRAEHSPDLALHREERAVGFAVHWLTLNGVPADPKEFLTRPEVAARFGAFLDRERPEVVHFQHVVKLGIDLLHETAVRRLPTVYTAHDYFAVCHRYTLLRPDLEHCEVRGDSMACAHCDVALSYLNALPELGDYQMGVLPDQIGPARWAALAAILDDDPDPAGLTVGDVDRAYDARREMDSLRATAFGKVDAFIAPTQFLADELVAGGIERERIEVLPYGIENEDLSSVPPAGPTTGAEGERGPVRFGFFGGLSKHKGVHHLLAAFTEIPAGAELSLWGYSTDAPYLARLREAATAAGAKWCGSYEREELPALLAEVDVVVVPSCWVENYPLVIREAFSARRPVIACRFGALPESVRDGVDGFLVEPRDPAALAAAMGRFVREPELVGKMAAAIERVKSIDEQAGELSARYGELVAAARAQRDAEDVESPASVRGFRARTEELAALPARDLFRRALAGLERLEAGLSPTGDATLSDRRAEYEWIREKLEAGEVERGWLGRELEWQRREVAWQRSELERVARDGDESRRAVEELQDELRSATEGGEELRVALEHAERTLEKSEGYLRTTAELGASALRAQEALLGAEVGPMVDLVHYMMGSARTPAAGVDAFGELIEAVREGRATAHRLAEEIGWRRGAMDEVRLVTQRRLLWALLRRTGVGKTIATWPPFGPAPVGDEGPAGRPEGDTDR